MDPFAPLSPAERALLVRAPLPGSVVRFADVTRFRDAIWTEPRPVAQIGVAGWTRDGRPRHPRLLGLRADTTPEEVVRE